MPLLCLSRIQCYLVMRMAIFSLFFLIQTSITVTTCSLIGRFNAMLWKIITTEINSKRHGYLDVVYALLKNERSPEGEGRLGFIKHTKRLNLLKALSILQVLKAYLGFFPVINMRLRKENNMAKWKRHKLGTSVINLRGCQHLTIYTKYLHGCK